MTPQEYVNWLNELLTFNPNLNQLNKQQTQLVKDKLQLVFNKVTPDQFRPNRIPYGGIQWQWPSGIEPTTLIGTC